MSGRGIKSNGMHPYQRKANPFWRHSNLPPTMGYSDETKEMLELRKIEYDQSAKFIQWETRPAIQ